MLYIKEYLVNFSVLITIIYLSGFLYKHFLVNSSKNFIEFSLIVMAIISGWCSMFFGIHLNDSVIFDLRFIPIIIAAMYTRNPFYILIVGLGIGFARMSFGISEAAIAGFITLIILSIVGMIVYWTAKKWHVYTKMIVIVLVMNSVNTLSIGFLGVIPLDEYLSVILPSSLPINIVLSFFLLWMVKDLSDEYVYKTNLLNSARKDPLTQLYNRRAFKHYYDLYTSKKRGALPLSLAFIDIDHFKKVNDQYGHIVGDVVLQKVSQIISNNLRNVDIISRYGGEEFVVILPFCDKEDVQRVIERIRYTTETHPIVVDDLNISITLSAGVATSPDIHVKQLLERADEALYAAKENGRNQVAVANNEGIIQRIVVENSMQES